MTIPVRHKLLAVTFSLAMLLFVDRIAISVAKSPISGEFGLTDTQFGWAMSAFALGYAFFQVPAGQIADRWGPRIALALMVILWSMFTGLTGLAWGFVSLLVVRFIFGVAEAGAFPTFARAIYSWFPPSERAFAQGINLAGARVGAAIAFPAMAWLLTIVSWQSAFLILGAFGVIWAAGWYLWFRDTPEEHRAVSAAELAHIIDSRPAVPLTPARVTVPAQDLGQGSLSRSKNVRLLMIQYFTANFTSFFGLTWLFPYLQQTYGLDALHTGLLASVPLLAAAAGSWAGGIAVDILFRRTGSFSSRRSCAMAGFAIAAVGICGSLYADSPAGTVIWFSLATFGADFTKPASWAFCVDIGTTRSGAVSGMMNMAGNLGSFVTSLAFPYLAAAFESTGPFFVTAVVLNLFGMLLWTQADPQRGLH